MRVCRVSWRIRRGHPSSILVFSMRSPKYPKASGERAGEILDCSLHNVPSAACLMTSRASVTSRIPGAPLPSTVRVSRSRQRCVWAGHGARLRSHHGSHGGMAVLELPPYARLKREDRPPKRGRDGGPDQTGSAPLRAPTRVFALDSITLAGSSISPRPRMPTQLRSSKHCSSRATVLVSAARRLWRGS